jgi:hypothetical protein
MHSAEIAHTRIELDDFPHGAWVLQLGRCFPLYSKHNNIFATNAHLK